MIPWDYNFNVIKMKEMELIIYGKYKFYDYFKTCQRGGITGF